MEEKLVSIIVVCYNGEKYVKRCFESILNQTYNKIEIVFVNDDSIDNTEDIVKSYEDKIQKRGYKFQYIYQKKSGQAVALNTALKVFKGDFLAFLDVDDEIERTSIEKRVNYLMENKECGLVRTTGKMVDEDTNEVLWHIQHIKNKNRTDIFDDLVMERDIWVANGCYMIRTEAFVDAIPDRNIYTHKGGQNWQVLLPVTRKYKCGYIDEELFIYHVIKNSHSHKEGTFEMEFERCCGHEEILKHVLQRINEYDNYEKRLIDKYSRRKMELARKYKEKEILKKEMKNLLKNKTYSLKDFYIFFLGLIGL